MINRKDEHVNLALKYHSTDKKSHFDDIKFVYHSLSTVDVSDVDLSTTVLGLKMEYPFYINAMTGGSEKTKEINEKLAYVAKETGIAIASGSLSAALKDESKLDSFIVLRETNKNGLVFANVGAEYTSKEAQKAIDFIKADMLQVHINLIQELVMPEGDRKFKHWKSNIKDIVSNISVPVIVKEVGFGMSRETIKTLKDLNVKAIDVSGAGGTNFVTIENARREHKEYAYLEDFGLSTPMSLLEGFEYSDDIEVLASGGIRHPLDIIKVLSLNAKAVGISGLLLNTLMNEGVECTIELINQWKEELRILMTLLNARDLSELKKTNMVINGDLYHWCRERNIDTKHFASRKK